MDQDALDAWRQRCGFPTWEAAAEALGLSKAHMSRYKSGQRPIPRIVANACAGVEARLLVRSGPAPEIRTLELRPSDLPGPRFETGHAEPRIRAVAAQTPAPSALRAAAGWPGPRGREASAPLGDLDSASPKADAIAAVASSGYAYAAAATPSRLTKPRGGARLSLLTPIPAPAQPSTAKDKKGDRP